MGYEHALLNKLLNTRKELKMSRCIKSLKKLKSLVGKEVKVCTLDNVIGICLVAEDDAGDTCLISKDKALLKAKYFWEIRGERERIKDCTAKYIAGHYCWREHQLTDELKWVTSSVPSKKSAVKAKSKPAKETDEEIVLEPKSVEELWAKAPCKVRLKDGQIGYAETEAGRKEHATVYFNKGVDGGLGWEAHHTTYKRGWHVNCIQDFEMIFGKKDEEPVVETKETKTSKLTRDDAFRPLNLDQLREHVPCHVLLKDDQIAYVDYEHGTPTVYMQHLCDGEIGWPTDAEGFNYGWHLNDEEDFKEVFYTFDAEPVEKTPEDTSVPAVLKEILETLKEIKNEIAKR